VGAVCGGDRKQTARSVALDPHLADALAPHGNFAPDGGGEFLGHGGHDVGPGGKQLLFRIAFRNQRERQMLNIRWALSLVAAMSLQPTLLAAQTKDPLARPVAIVMPYAAGGTNDNEARIYTQKVQEATGQRFVFDYRPGAGTSIGLAYVAKAMPDGGTLLMTNSSLTIHPYFYDSLPYDVQSSFAPITILSSRSTALIINVAALQSVRSIADLVTYARSNPTALSCNTSGSGTIAHIVCAWLASEAKINIVPVHYKGVAQGQVDLLAGRTQLQPGTWFTYLPMIRTGKLRAIAVLGEERSKFLPEVRTMSEQGLNVEMPSWIGVLAPAGTPQSIINKVHGDFVTALRSPDVSSFLETAGNTPVGNTPEAFKARIVKELAQWKKIIQENGIKGE
jgi:tripartite-type tricarboxylate transporter receptor subunit TctC